MTVPKGIEGGGSGRSGGRRAGEGEAGDAPRTPSHERRPPKDLRRHKPCGECRNKAQQRSARRGALEMPWKLPAMALSRAASTRHHQDQQYGEPRHSRSGARWSSPLCPGVFRAADAHAESHLSDVYGHGRREEAERSPWVAPDDGPLIQVALDGCLAYSVIAWPTVPAAGSLPGRRRGGGRVIPVLLFQPSLETW